jgi:FkbM family methyltransferase
MNGFGNIKHRLKSCLLSRWDLQIPVSFGRSSFAQEGEDVLLWRIIQSSDRSCSCYVDVGSNHPFRMSNSAFFYRMGWSGIAIDPNPDFVPLYKQMRPRDVFVNCGVATLAGSLSYFEFSESLFNTFDEAKAREIAANHSSLLCSREVSVRRLDDILNEHWPSGKSIRFLSVDCEGLDLDVLQSHDFIRYPTEFVCVEIHASTVTDVLHHPTFCYLGTLGYECIAKLANSCFFLRRSCFREYGI